MKTKIFFCLFIFCLFNLAQPARAATVEVNPSADAFVDTSQPNRNFGRDTDIAITSTPASDAVIGFVSFDFRPLLPTGATLERADLKLYQRNRTCANMPTHVFRATRSWSENSITYNNSAGNYTTNQGAWLGFPIGTGTGTAWTDVTDIVKGWARGTYANYGLVIYNMTHNNCFASFSSREGNHRPLLQLTYSLPADTAAPRIAGLAADPAITSARITWSTNEVAQGTVAYRKTGNPLWILKTETNSPDVQHSVTLSGLTAGTRYEYQARAKDAAGNLGLSAASSFTTDSLRAIPGSASQPSGNNDPQNNQQLSISDVQAENWDPTTVRLTWHSNLPSTSWAFVSATADDNTPIGNYEILLGRNDGVTDHEVFADGLETGVTYSFRVFSRSADNQTATSPRRTFTLTNQTQTPPASSGQSGDPGYQPLDPNDTGEVDLDQVRREADAAAGQTTGADQAMYDQLKKDALADYQAHKSGFSFLPVLPLLAQALIAAAVIISLFIILIVYLVRRSRKNAAGQTDGAKTP